GYPKRVAATPTVCPRSVQFLHSDTQGTGQKSPRVNTTSSPRSALF
ncbi:unnamed protein product, partial [Choristocarpus tenellus]